MFRNIKCEHLKILILLILELVNKHISVLAMEEHQDKLEKWYMSTL